MLRPPGTIWVLFVAAAGCSDAITLSIETDRPAGALDAMCVGVADRSASGGHFGRAYRLADIGGLPQTLRVDPGKASAADAWVRGDRGGVPVAIATARVDFASDVTVDLAACVRGPAAAPAQVGEPVGEGRVRLVASYGQGGAVAVAIGTQVSVIDAGDGALVATPQGAVAGTVTGAIAVDVDGDCDDDVIVSTAENPPELWRRDGATFVDVGPIGDVPLACAAADVDQDGDLDLVCAGGGFAGVFLDDGAGSYALDAARLDPAGRIDSAIAVALGDLDGDGNPDLVVGQDGGPLVAWFGQDGGSFLPADGAVPAVPLAVESLTLADADGDFDPDLAVSVRGDAWRLLVDRDGRLEDQSFVRVPQPAASAHAVVFGGWDDGCEPDAYVASDDGVGASLHGVSDGTFAVDGDTPGASDAVFVDVDDDGDLDVVIATDGGVRWLAR